MKAPVIELNGSAILGALFPVAIVERVTSLAASEGLGRCQYLRNIVHRHLEDIDAQPVPS